MRVRATTVFRNACLMEALEEMGWSQAELARRVGMNHTTISKLCRLGGLTPEAPCVQKVAARFRQGWSPHAAFDERNAQRAFQRGDLPADRRLGRFENPGCAAERALLCRRKKRPHVIPVKGYRLPVHALAYSRWTYFRNRQFAGA